MVWLILLVSDAVRTLPVLVKILASQKLMLLSLLLFTEEKSIWATNCKLKFVSKIPMYALKAPAARVQRSGVTEHVV